MNKKILYIITFLSAMICLSAPTYAKKHSKTKNDSFWENYMYYHIVAPGEVEALAIDKDYAEAKDYYDPDLNTKSKRKVTFTYPATVKHAGKTYKLTRLPDYECSNYFDEDDLQIIPTKRQDFEYYPSGEIDDGNGWSLNYLNSVTKIVMPDTLEYIGTGSLSDCMMLKEIVFAKKYDFLTFGDYVFVTNKLKKIKIPEGTYKLGDMALGYIPEISLPYSLKKIGNYVVNSKTKKVTIATGNKKFKIKDGILYSSDGTVLYSASAKVPKNVTIPSKVNEIKPCAFAYSNIETVTFSNKFISSLPSGVFANCKRLDQIIGLKEVNFIEYAAFAGCIKLTSISNPIIYGMIAKAAFWDTKDVKMRLYDKVKVKKYAFDKPTSEE